VLKKGSELSIRETEAGKEVVEEEAARVEVAGTEVAGTEVAEAGAELVCS